MLIPHEDIHLPHLETVSANNCRFIFGLLARRGAPSLPSISRNVGTSCLDQRADGCEVRSGSGTSFSAQRPHPGIVFNEHYDGDGATVFEHACALGCEGIVSKRLGSPYRSGRADCWVKVKNPSAPAVRREAEEDWQ